MGDPNDGPAGEPLEVHCLHCDGGFTLSEAYGKYQGPAKCSRCGQLLRIRSEAGRLLWVEAWSPSDETLLRAADRLRARRDQEQDGQQQRDVQRDLQKGEQGEKGRHRPGCRQSPED